MLQQNLYIYSVRVILMMGMGMALMEGSMYAQSDSKNMGYWYQKITGDTIQSNRLVLYYLKPTTCKGYTTDSLSFVITDKYLEESKKNPSLNPLAIKPIPFIQIHGNISYTFDYRSQLDTPFTATNLQQHHEQTYLDATLKGQYPFRVILNSRQSNSPYFRNYTDLNIQFNHKAFEQSVKQAMIADITNKMQYLDSVKNYELLLNKERADYQNIKSWIESPSRMQEIIQEKERIYKGYLELEKPGETITSIIQKSIAGKKDSAALLEPVLSKKAGLKDSMLLLMHQPTQVEKKLRGQEKVLDSIYKRILLAQHSADSLKNAINRDIADVSNKIKNARSVNELETIAKNNGIKYWGQAKKNILSFTQLGIGRSTVNYSDLTVNNISLKGLNVEFNPSYYAAFAIGSVDYLLRDFIIKPGYMPKQNLVLGRFGWGFKEQKNIVFTAYTGTKNNFGGSVSDTTSFQPQITISNILGYSVEAKYNIGQNIDASVEFAKSSPRYNIASDKTKSFGQAFNFSNRLNEAWSAKLNISLPASRSFFNMFYKRVGADFQSYSIYNSGTQQESWGIKWHQYLFKNKLGVTAQVKKSSFEDAIVPVQYNSSMLFKSFQVVYRKKKWPMFTAGYMPTTQLIRNSSGYILQSIYYALTANVFYNYSLLKLRMNSNLMFNRFYNKGTDSGFVFYNAKSMLYSHNIEMGIWHSQSQVQYMMQPGLSYWTFQERLDIQIGKSLFIGAGLSNNIVPLTKKIYWGGNAKVDLQLKQVGGLRLQFEKGYLYNGADDLMPNNWGRAMWYKVF